MGSSAGKARSATARPLRWGRRVLWALVLSLTCWLLFTVGSAVLTFLALPAAGLQPGWPSLVYAADGTEVGPLTGDVYQVPVSLEELPAHVPQAFVAVEDIRFYQHRGVDLRGIARALVANLLQGEIAEGGSTITQQVVKNLFLTPRQTLSRKLQEAVLAILMERRYEKDQILSLYLNQLYMGHGTYGVGAAARLYFNKDAADLTIGEAALLAGITSSPETFSPLRDPEAAKRMRDLALDRMVAAGYLEPEQAEAVKAEPVTVSPGELDRENPYPWYMDAVRDELRRRYRLEPRVVALMGLKIHTGLDPTLQRAAEQRLAARIFPAHTPDGVEAAFAAVDPRTGQVRALVGGREYPLGGGLNRATDGRLPPGSVLKPIVVYAPAIEYKGYTPDSPVKDEPINIDGWEPQNWDFKFRGEVTLREAARLSLNVPAVNLLREVGLDRARRFAANLGIPLTEKDRNLTLALGAMAEGLSPLELAGAYQPFANGGTYREPHLITRVEAGASVLRSGGTAVRRVMKPRTAYYVTDLLQTVVRHGTGTGALLDRPMAGKTGTVELPAGEAFQGLKGNSAAWFVGYTPDLVAAIWVGYDQIDPEHYLPPEVNGSTHPTWLWRQVVGAALAGRPALAFPGPDGEPVRTVETPEPPAPAPEKPAEPPEPALPGITALAASPGPQPLSVNLTWSAQGGTVPDEHLRFLILRGTTPDLPVDPSQAIAAVTGPPYLDVLTQPGVYFYRVVAVDQRTGAMGEPSAPLRVEIRAEPPGDGDPGAGQPEPTGPGETDPGQTQPGDGGTDEGEPGDGNPGGGGTDQGEPGDGNPGGGGTDQGEPGDRNPGGGEDE